MSQYGQDPQGDYNQPNYGSQPYGQSQQGGYGSYQQPTGMQQYAAYGQQAEHPQAQTVLILGILGFFTSITAFIGWYMGGQAKKEIEAGAPYCWDGNLKTGYLISKILSIISIVALAFIVLMFILMLAGLFAMGSM
ncbi:hypothetical protein [uncultured Tessaracoccus sp.]|uniref:hypothetical protein n=1 Tax=uncultured Tessaracoccus sp. TaxID=905023 RepID=UPI00261B9FA8|nr:hypothetical protein [uncultured Tessaracoccus sp.]